MKATIEQNHLNLGELCLICSELGITHSNPAQIGDERFCSALDQLSSIECSTGYGGYTLRKRENGRWIAEKRIGEVVRQVTVGRANMITSEKLDNAALNIYSSADKSMSARDTP